MDDLVGAFIAWTDKRRLDLDKRLGPKLTMPFWQYVAMFKAALEDKDE